MDNFREWEYKYQNQIKQHIRCALPNLQDLYSTLVNSSEYEDSVESYDMIYKIDFTVSVRIRRHKYLKYPDLTIRSKSMNGGKTEIDKIMEGKAQVYFYAYLNEQATELVKIQIVDVSSIRFLYLSDCYTHHKNPDGTEFLAFKFDDIKQHYGSIYQYDQQ